MDLSLIAQVEKVIDIDGIKITINPVDPLLQVEIIEELVNKEINSAKDRVLSYKFIFEKVIKNVNRLNVDYAGSDFFSTFRITKDENILFMNKVAEEIINFVFLPDEEVKK